MSDSVASMRKPIDSGVSVGEDDKMTSRSSESTDDDVVFDDKTATEEAELDIATKENERLGPVAAVKQRILSRVDQAKSAAKYFAIAFLIWVIGYFGFSFLWLALGVGIFLWREEKRKNKELISQVLDNIANDERKYFQTVKNIYRLSDRALPSWVYFPDVEKAEWLNKILVQIWPNVGDFVQKTILEKVEPSIRASNPLLKGLTFSKVDLGERSPRVAGMKVYDNGQTRRTEIIMDLQIIYESDCNIRVSMNKLNAGIRSLSVRGLMRVELRPLVKNIPFVGAVSVCFVNQPMIDFDLTDLGNFLDLPVVDSVLRTAISDCVSSMLVLPEKYIIRLTDDIDIGRLMFPLPKGVVRVHIIEAKNLEEKDRKILGIGGGSDPFVEVKVGRDHEFRTKIIEHDVNPKWNESFDALVTETHTSVIEITLYDDDGALTKADYLGSASVQMKSVYKRGVIDEWIPLSNVKQGAIHVRIEWLDLSDDLSHMTEAMEHAGKHNLNSALIDLYIDSARDLPGFNEGRYEPSPVVKIEVPGYTKPLKTKIIPFTNNPTWEENFRTLVQNPRMESLGLTVFDSGMKDEVLGKLRLRIDQLLKAPGMMREEHFQLLDSGPNSQLLLRLTVRLLKPKGKVEEAAFADHARSAFLVAEGKEPNVENEVSPKGKDEGQPEPAKTEEKHDLEPEIHEDTVDAVLRPPEKSTPSEGSTASDAGASFGSNPSRSSSVRSGLVRNASNASEMSHVLEAKNLKDRLDQKVQGMGNGNPVSEEFRLGRLKMTLSYSEDKEKLNIDVHKAENLIVCDEDHKTSDPYVRIYLRDQRLKTRRKTKVIKNTLNPVFDERLDFSVVKEEFSNCHLDISVKNKTGLLSSEKVLMGQVSIKLSELDLKIPVSNWYTLQVGED